MKGLVTHKDGSETYFVGDSLVIDPQGYRFKPIKNRKDRQKNRSLI